MNPRKAETWMRLALDLAERGRWGTSPNPRVGACIVKNQKWIASGYHRVFGGEHAEAEAIRHAGERARGADLYVTLEPCSTWGKTPPCVGAIYRAGIKRVYVASLDPNPIHHRTGVQWLRRHGIAVEIGMMAKDAQSLNAFFFKYMATGMPYVTLKMAQSLDGKIATPRGESRWISSPESRHWVQRLRAEQDALFVGTATAMRDNPRLTPRVSRAYRRSGKPWRIVLDPRAELPSGARIFEGDQPTLRVTAVKNIKKISALRAKKFSWLFVRENQGRLSLGDLFSQLGKMGIAQVLCEGGGELAWEMIRLGLVDRFVWILAPKIIGGRNAKTSVEGEGVDMLKNAFPVRIDSVERLGDDLLIQGFKK